MNIEQKTTTFEISEQDCLLVQGGMYSLYILNPYLNLALRADDIEKPDTTQSIKD